MLRKLLLLGLIGFPLSGMTEEQSLSGEHGIDGFVDVYKAASEFDPGLRLARMTYRAEREEKNIGLSSLLPDVKVMAGYQFEDSTNIYTDEDGNFFDPALERSAGELYDHFWRVTLRQPLFNYTAYQDYKRSLAYVDGAFYRYRQAEQQLVFRVSELYLKVLLARQKVYLNQQKLDALEQKLQQASRAMELSVGDQLSVLQARSSRDVANADMLEAKSDLRDAQAELSNVIGVTVDISDQRLQLSSALNPQLEPGRLEDWLAMVDKNLIVQEASARIREQNRNLLAAKGDHLPVVSLSLSHADRQSEDFFRTRTDNVAAVEVVMPIFTGGRMTSRVRRARASLEASRASHEQLRLEREQKIKIAYSRLVSANERLNALTRVRESSAEYLRAAERQLSLKLADQVAVLEARTQLIDAGLQFAETLNSTLLADLSLRLETGELSADRLRYYDRLFGG